MRKSAVGTRVAFAVVTASLLLVEVTLTRVFSGTIGYYFAFMSISIAMLGLGTGSLWVTLRGERAGLPERRAGLASLGLSLSAAAATLVFLRFYPAMGDESLPNQLAQVLLFGALFVPFFFGGVVVAAIFEAYAGEFGLLYAIDLVAAAAGCVLAVPLLQHVAAPEAMLVIAACAGAAAPLFLFAAGERRRATSVSGGLIAVFAALFGTVHGSPVLSPLVIRNQPMTNVVVDRWNDFSRVLVKQGPFFTWGLSETYRTEHPPQYDLLIEGVAGTQIQHCPDGDASKLDFLRYDVSSLPHLLRPTGSALTLGVGAGLDVMMAKHYGKDPIVGVEVNPLVGDIVNEQFGAYSGRPYHLPGVTVHFENARTFVKRDRNRYDVVTVTWVDSGAATGAGAFALTENYLYTVEAFRDYLSRLKDDGVLAFMRSRYSPEYDAIKGIGVAVEALRAMGIADPGRYVTVTSVASPHFGRRELTQVLVKRTPFSAGELAIIDEAQKRLHFKALYTPGRTDGDADIERLITGTDRAAVYASFAFDMEPNTDDRPFYFFLRERIGQPGGREVRILRQSMVTIFVMIGVFALFPLGVLLRRNIGGLRAVATSTAYFSLLGLGFMLIEMKLLQQSVLIIGNPTLSLAAVLAALLLSTGAGALLSQRQKLEGAKAAVAFLVLLASLVVSLATSGGLADWLTGFSLPVRTLGLMLAIAPVGVLLGLPMPLGISRIAARRDLVAWCWGINGMFGVAGSAVAIYVAIHFGLSKAFLLGIACYIGAALVFWGSLATLTRRDDVPAVAPALEPRRGHD
jgi:spermidine synthase